MPKSTTLRRELAALLESRNAHLNFRTVIERIPPNLRGVKPAGLPHTPWQILEHMRICQWDIVEFSRNPAHVSPRFPEGYWPEAQAPPSDSAWRKSVSAFQDDLKSMKTLILDESVDLFEPFSHAEEATLLHEVLLLADHNAYHLGQMVTCLRLLGDWERVHWNPMDAAEPGSRQDKP